MINVCHNDTYIYTSRLKKDLNLHHGLVYIPKRFHKPSSEKLEVF